MKRLILLTIIILSFIFYSNVSFAQSIANCDVCGYCKDSEAPTNWDDCRKCAYPDTGTSSPEEDLTIKGAEGIPTPHPDYHYTMIGCISTQPGDFTNFIISKLIIPIVGGIAFLYLLYGAGIVATSQTDPEKLNYGKRIIYGAIVGLIFVLLSTFVIRFIAVDVFKLPGFGGN